MDASRLHDAIADDGGRFAAGIHREHIRWNCCDLYGQVQSIPERAGEPAAIHRDLLRRAAALAIRV